MVTELSKTIGVTEATRPRRFSQANILLLLEGKRNEIGAAESCFAPGEADFWLTRSGNPVCRRCHAKASGAEEETQ
jgi:hypothetical protein